MTHRFALLMLLTSGLVACTSTTSLSSRGAAIRALSADAVAECEKLEAVEKHNSNSVQSKEASEEDARNKVLNAAASAGGTHVRLYGFEPWLEGTCSNCVKLRADVYRCDGAVDDMDVMTALYPQQEPVGEPDRGGESNHADHDLVCTNLAETPAGGDACQYDTQCTICHDGSDCG